MSPTPRSASFSGLSEVHPGLLAQSHRDRSFAVIRFSVQRHYAAMQPLTALGHSIHAAGRLEPALIELVQMRASQINGCAYCLDMHSKDARAAGESEQR